MSEPALLTLAAIEAAAARLAGHAVRTPLIEAHVLGRTLGCRVLIKAEVLQRTGSFKFRGAFNRLSQLSVAERGRGVVAYSSGNHAQAVAAAAGLLGTPATIVMPRDAPAVKLDRTRRLGARIILYDRVHDDRAAIAQNLADKDGLVLVPPYDDPDVMAGQGTAGLEIVEQARALGLDIDAVLVPCGGGGLTAGVATAVTTLSPGTAVVTVEPEGFDDTALSLKAGERMGHAGDRNSICDALLAPMPGLLTFAVNRGLVRSGLVVSDDAVRAAMAYAFAELRLVVEPGGAVALAALLGGLYTANGGAIVVVLSGGNVDPDVFAGALR